MRTTIENKIKFPIQQAQYIGVKRELQLIFNTITRITDKPILYTYLKNAQLKHFSIKSDNNTVNIISTDNTIFLKISF